MPIIKTKCTLLIIMCFFMCFSYAQNVLNPIVNELVPPSPNASSIGKFGNIPVGPSTGIPAVSIPVFSHQCGNLGMDVSLNYHAGGVRVMEVASNVGLGWALSTGAISRTVRGTYDELATGGFINSVDLPKSYLEGNRPAELFDRPFVKINDNLLDSKNDVFTYSFGGTNGKFYLGKRGDSLIAPQRKLKIGKKIATVNGSSLITQFEITDEKGIKYVFGSYEITTVNNGKSNNTFTSSWFLTEIISDNQVDTIRLTYTNVNISRYFLAKNMSETRMISQGGVNTSSSVIDQSIAGKRIDKITFPDGVSINFTYNGTARQDLPGDYLLKKISITDKGGNKRGVILEQDYSLNRATLNKVVPFSGPTEVQSQPYVFKYGAPLPDRMSNDQDHWGFYNRNAGGYLIPAENFSGLGGITYLSGGNREVDVERCLYGSLTRIDYPTKGYTIFEMEPNKAVHDWSFQNSGYVGGLRVRKIKDYDGISSKPVSVREYEYLLEDETTSSGKLGVHPVYSFAIYYEGADPNIVMEHTYPVGYSPNYIIRSNAPVLDLAYANGSPVTYGRVTEKITNENGEYSGKTVREFTAFGSQLTPSSFPFVLPSIQEWAYGLLKKETIYNSTNKPVKSVENIYDNVNDLYYQDLRRRENFRNISIGPVKFQTYGTGVNPNGKPVYFLMNEFLPEAGRSELKKQVVTEYTNGVKDVEKITEYIYDAANYYLKEEALSDSRLEKRMKRISYPKDMVDSNQDPETIYQKMINANMIDIPIEEITYKNNTSTQLERTKTSYHNPMAKVYAPLTVQKSFLGKPLYTEAKFDAYDRRGNILQFTPKNGLPISYLWNYNGQHLIAEVQNALQVDIGYANFESDEADGNFTYYGTPTVSDDAPGGKRIYNLANGDLIRLVRSPEKAHVLTYWARSASANNISGATAAAIATRGSWTLYRRIVQGSSSFRLSGSVYIDEVRFYPVGSQMKTYTYDPLVGITSSTDASDRTTVYEYDGFGRLQYVKDQQGNIIENYDYKYRNQ